MVKIKERPIIFDGESVRAILDGRKTQTRRVIKCTGRCRGEFPDPASGNLVLHDGAAWDEECLQFNRKHNTDFCVPLAIFPYGKVGDRLWVKEAFRAIPDPGANKSEIRRWKRDEFGDRLPIVVDYRIDNPQRIMDQIGKPEWSSPLFMPHWASRLLLEITEIRVQRVQKISEGDAIAEGVEWNSSPFRYGHTNPISAYKSRWNHINGKRAPWDSNPWAWAITFKRLEVA